MHGNLVHMRVTLPHNVSQVRHQQLHLNNTEKDVPPTNGLKHAAGLPPHAAARRVFLGGRWCLDAKHGGKGLVLPVKKSSAAGGWGRSVWTTILLFFSCARCSRLVGYCVVMSYLHLERGGGGGWILMGRDLRGGPRSG